jgi:catechol 2,3-dioxygenase-like lactoylglutathione lyase family enzyme
MSGAVETKLELVVMPVSDADRAREFYTNLGWRLDADFLISAIFAWCAPARCQSHHLV